MPTSVSENIRRFFAEHIRSVAQLELLLLLCADPRRSWSAQAASGAIYTAPDMTQRLLDQLLNSGLLAADDQKTSYRYAPSSDEFCRVVEETASLYRDRPMAAISLIYAERGNTIQDFADAFRLRRKTEE